MQGSPIFNVRRYFVFALLSVSSSMTSASAKQLDFDQYAFRRDVVRRAEERARTTNEFRRLEDLRANSPSFFQGADVDRLLLEKAIPREEYESHLRSSGQSKQGSDVPEFTRTAIQEIDGAKRRHLEDEDCDGEDCGDGDDYIIDDDEQFDFAGYSLKYAMCQKIARFSAQAVRNGEYSSLVTDDIVFLRLCPKRHCSSSVQWGCSNGYGEYAMLLKDYLNVMLHYQIQKQEAMCEHCYNCANGGYDRERDLEDAGDDAAGDDDAGDYDDAGGYDDAAAAAGDDGAAVKYSNDPCDTYADYCDELDADGACANMYDDDNNNGDDDSKLDLMDYINYFDCIQVQGQNGGVFYVSPRCDPQSTKIQMGIFYDSFCSQYAGNEYNLNEFSGVNFNNEIFEEFYSGDCINCAKSNDAPFYNTQSNVCNKVYQKSGKCDTYLAVTVNDDDAYDKSSNSDAVCSFIDSVRYGSYDSNGEVITSGKQFGSNVQGVVTFGQTMGLVFTCLTCAALALYSCYLHHSITNVLLKSLSHGTFASSSERSTARSKSRSKRSSSKGRRSKEGRDKDDDGSDWDYQMS
mmetsp:Transcript_29598/g.43678  ORF Transcript_29598/g.43678 Transcript_29598/m.43678 type:complete len:574 (-) Transcript_29598:227-1948(-)